MNTPNALLATQMLLSGIAATQRIAQLLNNAQNGDRDVTPAELANLAEQHDVARAELESAIQAARADGR